MIRRVQDRDQRDSLERRGRKFDSLLELGRLIGLDLELDEMLLQIAWKACEVMEADRSSLFLYDPKTDELWSTVALGMGKQVIRIPSGVGVAGSCFQTGETISLEDAYADSRFNKQVDTQSGYHTGSLLCLPLYRRDGERLGVIQLLNKMSGGFDEEDIAFLRTFANHASVFIEMAQLQRSRMDALEQAKKDLEGLNRAKSRALDHLSHEIRTPLAIIQGNIRLLKRRILAQDPPLVGNEYFASLEKNLNRLSEVQQETDQIIRCYAELEERSRLEGIDLRPPTPIEPVALYAIAERILEEAKSGAPRDLQFFLEGAKDISVNIPPEILEDILRGLLKNAIENTPDEGFIRIVFERKGQSTLLKVQDVGIGITQENQKYLFDGLFHTLDTELYTSKKPYDFGAGGKGLDLLRVKIYGQQFGFDISVRSQRCIHIPNDSDLCPGKISSCPHCKRPEGCHASGGSTFCVTF